MPILLPLGILVVCAILVVLLNPLIPLDWGGAILCRCGAHGGPFTEVDGGWSCARCGRVLPRSAFTEDRR